MPPGYHIGPRPYLIPRGRTDVVVLVLLVFGVLTALAYVQQPHPEPLRKRTFWEWVRYPVQRNGFVGQAIQSRLNAVYALPGTERVWAVGDGGLVVYSTDGGATWAEGRIELDSTAALPTDTTAGGAAATDTTQGSGGTAVDSLLADDADALDAYTSGLAGDTAKGDTKIGDSAAPAQIQAQTQTQTQAQPQTQGGAEAAGSRAYAGNLTDVFFADSLRGWAVSWRGDVLASRDGGKTWTVRPRVLPAPTTWIAFENANRGYAIAAGRLYNSGTGGELWRMMYDEINFNVDRVTQGFLVRASSGTLLMYGHDDTLLATMDTEARFGGSRIAFTGSPLPFELSSATLHFASTVGWAAVDSYRGVTVWGRRAGSNNWTVLADSLPSLRALAGDTIQGLVGVGFDGHVVRSTSGGQTWDTVRVEPGHDLHDVVMDEDGRGWAVGDHGTVLATRDGGATWQRSRADARLSDIDFADAMRGWAVGRSGTVLATTNGGRTWRPQGSGATRDLRAVSFPDRRHGWAVGDDLTMIATRDGGRHWESRRVAAFGDSMRAADFTDVFFVGPDTGWIVAGDVNLLLATTDGGRTWEPRHFVRPLSVQFIDGRRGWVVGGTAGGTVPLGGSSIWKTDDGGASWRDVGGDFFLDGKAWFASDSAGWATDMYGGIMATRDGGRTWARQRTDGAGPITDLRFADERRGWAVGPGGAVLGTTDGGATWQALERVTEFDLHALEVQDGRVWAVGSGAVALRSADGAAWSALAPPRRWPAPWYYAAAALTLVALVRAGRLEPAASARTRQRREERSIEDLLIPDRPLQPGDPDPFDLGTLAQGITNFLRNPNTEPPLTLAVTGRWGTGKSSLMNLVKCGLQDAGFRPVWFNAWHHQQEDHLLAALLETIRAQAVPRTLSWAGLRFRARLFGVRTRHYRPSALAVYVLLVLLLGYFVAAPSRFFLALDAARDAWAALRPGGAGTLAGIADRLVDELALAAAGVTGLAVALWRSLKAFQLKPGKLLASAAAVVRFRDLQEQTGFRHRFAREFKEVTEALRPLDMVIFVDDLDRCRPGQVLQVLESINFLVSSGECTVVMGLDRDWVVACVGLEFDRIAQESAHLRADRDAAAPAGPDAERANRVRFATDYLDKLVNVEVPVPQPTPEQRREMVHTGAERDREARARRGQALAARVRRGPAPQLAVYGAVGAATLALSLLAFPPPEEPPAPSGPVAAVAVAAPAANDAATAAGPTQDTTVTALSPAESGAAAYAATLADAPAARGSLGVPLACAGVLLLCAVASLLRRPEPVVRDSAEFTSALKAWSGVVAGQGLTPRATKKFLNRLRFYAMRQRAHEPPETRWTRLADALRRTWQAARTRRRTSPVTAMAPTAAAPGLDPASVADAAASPLSPPAPVATVAPPAAEETDGDAADAPALPGAQPVVIPEPVLVALATLQQCAPGGVIPEKAWTDFHALVREDPLVRPFRDEILDPEFKYPAGLAGYRRRFEEISSQVRIR